MPTINKKPILVINLTKERNKERHKFYNNSQWRNLRKIYLQSHPLCEECLKSDVITPSSDVHHLQSPFEANLNDMERWRRLLDYDNLEAVCKDCHGKIHADKQKKLKKVDGLFEKIPKK